MVSGCFVSADKVADGVPTCRQPGSIPMAVSQLTHVSTHAWAHAPPASITQPNPGPCRQMMLSRHLTRGINAPVSCQCLPGSLTVKGDIDRGGISRLAWMCWTRNGVGADAPKPDPHPSIMVTKQVLSRMIEPSLPMETTIFTPTVRAMVRA
jgi:hypothetical protein